MASKLVHHLETALSQSVGSLTSKSFSVSVQDQAAAPPPFEKAIVWQQAFSVIDGPSFWIVAGRDLWESLGRLTLEAAGLDEVTDDDCRSTWQEIVNQTASGIASGITADLAREVTASKGQEVETEPPDLNWAQPGSGR